MDASAAPAASRSRLASTRSRTAADRQKGDTVVGIEAIDKRPGDRARLARFVSVERLGVHQDEIGWGPTRNWPRPLNCPGGFVGGATGGVVSRVGGIRADSDFLVGAPLFDPVHGAAGRFSSNRGCRRRGNDSGPLNVGACDCCWPESRDASRRQSAEATQETTTSVKTGKRPRIEFRRGVGGGRELNFSSFPAAYFCN